MEIPLRQDLTPQFRLIETFGYDPKYGVVRRTLHQDRLIRSAKRLGVPCYETALQGAIAAIQGAEALRCRLTLDRDGDIQVSTAAMPAKADNWTLHLSDVRLKADDPWLGIKSTERGLYDTVRANLPTGADEVIFLNQRDEVCEGTITSVFLKTDTGWITPPLSSGVLPGVFRESLLRDGACREEVVPREALAAAHRICVGNSLRGLIRATLA